jgi:hypothetical protein
VFFYCNKYVSRLSLPLCRKVNQISFSGLLSKPLCCSFDRSDSFLSIVTSELVISSFSIMGVFCTLSADEESLTDGGAGLRHRCESPGVAGRLNHSEEERYIATMKGLQFGK